MMAASPTNPHPIHLKKAHFLAPTATSAHDAAIAPPPPAAAIAAPSSFRRTFLGWKTLTENWTTWVDQMHELHHPTWRLAGILDAILASKCHITRNQDLLFHFLENYWCPATNTFVFPWGEATVTLEDVMVLGGYSVLGRPVFGPDPDGATQEAVNKLNEGRRIISNSTAKKPSHNGWITVYQGSESEIEHEAFLAYWLSRFVFPFKRDAIGKKVLPLAASLARGTRIALAPAVLAGIYHNLTKLQTALVSASGDPFEVLVTAPLPLVQAWVWERFRSLRPMPPREIGPREPRLARWHDVRRAYGPNDYRRVESRQDFEWRPYTRVPSNGVPRNVYRQNGYLPIADPDFGEELEGLVRCLRPSDLVGFEVEMIEPYRPHRVAMQFGLDQDVPGHAGRLSIMSAEAAWTHYSRPTEDATMYVPPQFYNGCVTVRYSEWWRKMRSDGERSELRRFLGRMFDLHPPPPTLSSKFKTVSLHAEGPSAGVRIRGFPPVRDSEPGKRRISSYEEGSSSKRVHEEGSSRGKWDDHGGVSPPPGFSPTPSS